MTNGDTCDAIASAHNVNTTLLHENNPQINPDCTNIYIGEVLCVASSVIVPPPASGVPPPSMPSTATPAVPSNTPPPSNNDNGGSNDDDDDDDLPYCDEL